MRRAFVLVVAIVACGKSYDSDADLADAGSTSSSSSSGATPDAAVGCGDTRADAKNCGACGHDCLGGACSAGACQPVLVASSQASPEAIVVTATDIYWTNIGNGTVMTAPKTGGPPRAIASEQASPRGLATDGKTLYWTNVAGGTVMHVPLDPSEKATPLAEGQMSPYDIAVSRTSIAWINHVVGGRVIHRARDTTVERSTVGQSPAAIAIEGADVYFTNDQVAMVSLFHPASGDVQGFAKLSARGIAVDARSVFVTVVDAGAGKVQRIDRMTKAATELATGRQQPLAIALDESSVYWVDAIEQGTVARVGKDGGAVTVLASNQSSPRAITVDQAAIYWVNNASGEIFKLAK